MATGSTSVEEVPEMFANNNSSVMEDLNLSLMSSRKWCDEEREALIEVVKKHPCLYDTNSKSYKDVTVKTNAKLEISHLFEDCTFEDVTTQWTQLVDTFRRVRKVSNIEDPTGTSAEDSSHVQLPQWDLYHFMSFLDQLIKQRTRFYNVSSAKVVNIDLVEGRTVMDQMNTGKIDNTDKDSYLIVFEDESLASLDNQSIISVENDSHLNSEDSFSISGTDSMIDPCAKNVLTLQQVLDSMSSSQNPISGKPTAIESSKKTESRQVFPKTSTPTPSTSSSTAHLPSHPDSRIKKKRKLEESQADKDISLLVSHLINDKQTDSKLHTAIEKKEEIDEVTKEWRNYCKVFADKVAKIKSSSIKDDVRFKMEQLLYEAGKKEKEKAKLRKKKEEEKLTQA
uniref:MADF domain-containing protein n=1 Tax=Daphnia galeata TaxID=27404 RepID=A0A8J2RJK6_9CRUS|nr:unnamed protein product [Daphnia galeata]